MPGFRMTCTRCSYSAVALLVACMHRNRLAAKNVYDSIDDGHRSTAWRHDNVTSLPIKYRTVCRSHAKNHWKRVVASILPCSIMYTYVLHYMYYMRVNNASMFACDGKFDLHNHGFGEAVYQARARTDTLTLTLTHAHVHTAPVYLDRCSPARLGPDCPNRISN